MKSTLVGIGLVAVAASMGMASCGESGNAALTNTTAIQLGATNYVTVPPTPSTDVAPTTTAAAQPEQEYIVQSGDYPSTIATRFNVPLQALMDVNGWRLEGQIAIGFPPAGTPIKIPAGGTVPAGATPTETTIAGATPAGVATTVATATAPVVPATPETTIDAGCVSQEYTITASDTSRLRVADKFGVTVQALDAANAGTNGYSAFYPGLVIKIPASSTDNC